MFHTAPKCLLKSHYIRILLVRENIGSRAGIKGVFTPANPNLPRHYFFFLQKRLSLKPLFSSLLPCLISPSLNQTHDLHGRSFKAQHKPPTPLPWPKLHGSTNSCRCEPPLNSTPFLLYPANPHRQPPPLKKKKKKPTTHQPQPTSQ